MSKKLKFEDLCPLTTYEAFEKSENKDSVKFKNGFFSKSQKRVQEIANIRGKIINHVISIEKISDMIIASYFSESLDSLFKFKNLILSKSQITTFLKWKILKEIMEDYQYFDEIKDCSQLRKEIHDIINTRDDFAHGELKFDTVSMNPYIEYYRNGIKKKMITQDYLDQLNKKLKNVHEVLSDVYLKILNEKYKTNPK